MFYIIPLAIPIVVVVLFVVLFKRTNKLNERISHMEKYIKNTTKDIRQNITTKPQIAEKEILTPEEILTKPVETNRERKQVIFEKTKPSFIGMFGIWLKEDWMMKLGGLLIVFGMAWFVNYAFVNNWVGPMGRIAIGLILGALILALGRYRISKYISQGGILMFVGALIMIFTIWVGHSDKYAFFSQDVAILMIFFTSSILGITSVALKRLPLAYANVFLAAVAPMLISSGHDSFTKLLIYLLVLTAGAVWVVAVTGWRQLILVSLLIIYFYSWINNFAEEGLLFGFIFTAIFFFVSILGMYKKRKTKIYDFAIAIISGFFILTWILASAVEEWQVMLLVAWTLVFAFGSFIALHNGSSIGFFYSYSGVGVMLLGVATAVQLDGPTLTIAYIIEAFIILYIGFQITKKVKIIPLLALPSIIPIILSFESMDYYLWHKNITNEHSLILILIISASVLLSKYFKWVYSSVENEDKMNLLLYSNVASVVASLYGIVYIWCASHVLFNDDWGLIIALFIYIGIGSALYISGKQTKEKWKRVIGVILIGVTSAYLILIAGMMLGLFGRIIAYMTIGVVLVAVAWHERSSMKNIGKQNISKKNNLKE